MSKKDSRIKDDGGLLDLVREVSLFDELDPTLISKQTNINDIKRDVMDNHTFNVMIKIHNPYSDVRDRKNDSFYIRLVLSDIKTDDIDFIDDVDFAVEYEILDQNEDVISEEEFYNESGLNEKILFDIMNKKLHTVQIFLHDLILDDLANPDEEEESLGLVDSKPKIKDCADNSGKKFVKFRYADAIWVDVKDDEHLLSTSTAYETMAQNKKKAIGNIKYQIKLKNKLPNSAKILLLEGKVKETNENIFYAENVLKEGKKMAKAKDSFAFVTPTEDSIVKKISDVTGKDLLNSGIKFYIIEGQDFDEEEYGDYGNEGYNDLIDRTREAMDYDNEARNYDYSKNLDSWIDSKASEIAGKLCDECEIEEGKWQDTYESIKSILKDSFPVKSFYGDCNKKKVADSKVKDSNDGAKTYRGYTLIYGDGKWLIIDPDGKPVREIEYDTQFENAVDVLIADRSKLVKNNVEKSAPLKDTKFIIIPKTSLKYGAKRLNLENYPNWESDLDSARELRAELENSDEIGYAIVGNISRKIYDSKKKITDSKKPNGLNPENIIDEYKGYILYAQGLGYVLIDPNGNTIEEFDEDSIDSFRDIVDTLTSKTSDGKEMIINI